MMFIPWGQPLSEWSPAQLREGLRQCDPDFFPRLRAKISAETARRSS